MMTLTREFYTPKGTMKITDPILNAEIHTYDENDKAYALAFSGKRQKPDFHHRFRSTEQRDDHIADYLKALAARKAAKDQRNAEKKAATHSLKVGDVVYNSWGYDQTNVDFYQVVAVPSNKTVRIQAIGSEMIDATGHMSGRTAPRKDAFLADSKPILKRVGKDNYISFKHGCGTPYSGEPVYCSWYA